MSTPSRQYQGESAEVRMRGRREALMRIAYECLVTEEWGAMSISKLCRQAGLNKRYFYESFDSLDALVAALVDEIASGLIGEAFAAARRANQDKLAPAHLSQAVMATLLTYLTDDPRRARLLFTDIADAPLTRSRRKDVMQRLTQALSAYAEFHYGAPERPDPMKEVSIHLLVGGSVTSILAWLEGCLSMDQQQFAADLAALWLSIGDFTAARVRSRQA